jgi:hypothetical protein
MTMASPALVPCLVQLRIEINAIAPARSKASDGWIGDKAHEQSVSDHNDDETGNVPIRDADSAHEVHAIDVDVDLNESDLTMEKVVQFLLGRCRSGAETRLRYIIFNRRIWSASSGWVQKTYTGASPHTEHAHFSASYTTSLEVSTASWHLEDIPVALTAADKTWIAAQIKASVDDILSVPIGDKANPGRTVGDRERDDAKIRGVLVGDPKDTANAALPADSPLARMIAAADKILAEPASK